MRRIAFTAIILSLIASPAFAHHRHHHYAHYRGVVAHSMVGGLGYGLGHMIDSIGARPHAWCGWEMRRELGVADPAYNLARNWIHYGSPAYSPHVGVIVVWPHHVGRVVGGEPGAWVVRSGNDGHAIRERVRSLSGAIAFRQ